jgi:predicted membrane protein
MVAVPLLLFAVTAGAIHGVAAFTPSDESQ